MKSILDPTFRYTPSHATDLRKTFARIRYEQSKSVHAPAVGAGVVCRMDDQQSKRKLVGDPYIKALLDEGMTLHKG